MDDHTRHAIDADDLAVGEVKSVVVAGRAVCLARTEDGFGPLDKLDLTG